MLATLSFGDLDAGVWGTVWDLGGQGFALLGSGVTSEATALAATLTGSTPDAGWQVSGGGTELEVTAEGEPAELEGGFDQLVRVHGSATLDGSELAFDCLGRRGTRDSIDPARFEAVRDVSAWFEPDLGMAVVASRPRGSTTHGDDVMSASVLEEGHSLQVTDPRLSTTYSGTGEPVRASFELWLERPPEKEDQPSEGEDDDAVRSFPRRAAGEALGARGSASSGHLEARAELFRWHARNRTGTGVYVLARLAGSEPGR